VIYASTGYLPLGYGPRAPVTDRTCITSCHETNNVFPYVTAPVQRSICY
jgi:hypothetical protein